MLYTVTTRRESWFVFVRRFRHDHRPIWIPGRRRAEGSRRPLRWFHAAALGLNVAVDNERVASVPAGSTEVPGPTPAELADELAILFDAECASVTRRPITCPGAPLGGYGPPVRRRLAAVSTPTIVKVGAPRVVVPPGSPSGVLGDWHRTPRLSCPPEGWNFGSALTSLSVTDGGSVFLVTGSTSNFIISHNWGMDAAIDGHDRTLGIDVASISSKGPGAGSWASGDRQESVLMDRTPSLRIKSWLPRHHRH